MVTYGKLWRLVHDQMRLATLEARLAGKSIVVMLIAGIMIAILLASAWLGVMTAAVLVLIGLGVAGSVAILFAIAVNLVLALILYRVIRHRSRACPFRGDPAKPSIFGAQTPGASGEL